MSKKINQEFELYRRYNDQRIYGVRETNEEPNESAQCEKNWKEKDWE
jgi:hypothetical protein